MSDYLFALFVTSAITALIFRDTPPLGVRVWAVSKALQVGLGIAALLQWDKGEWQTTLIGLMFIVYGLFALARRVCLDAPPFPQRAE